METNSSDSGLQVAKACDLDTPFIRPQAIQIAPPTARRGVRQPSSSATKVRSACDPSDLIRIVHDASVDREPVQDWRRSDEVVPVTPEELKADCPQPSLGCFSFRSLQGQSGLVRTKVDAADRKTKLLVKVLGSSDIVRHRLRVI